MNLLEEKLNAIYVTDLNDVDRLIDSLAWDAHEDWYQLILNPNVGYDLRGMAARVFTQSVYPRCPSISDPRRQTTFVLPREEKARLTQLRVGADTRLIPLGILEGLDRVSDFSMAETLFQSCEDMRVIKRLGELMSEEV